MAIQTTHQGSDLESPLMYNLLRLFKMLEQRADNCEVKPQRTFHSKFLPFGEGQWLGLNGDLRGVEGEVGTRSRRWFSPVSNLLNQWCVHLSEPLKLAHIKQSNQPRPRFYFCEHH